MVLEKQVTMRVLMILTLSFSLYYNAKAQQEPDTISGHYELNEYVVTASRSQLKFSEAARSIEVINAKEIRSMPVTDLGSLLEYCTGIDIRQRGALGQQADISMRGGSFDQVLVLLNGVSLSDPQTGHHNLDLPVDLSVIEKIEVLRGPGARVFGANAFAGVINIITKQPQYYDADASFTAGSFNYQKARISGSLQTKYLNTLISAGFSQSDGYTTNTDFRNHNVYFSGDVNPVKPLLGFQFGLTNKDFGANSFYTAKYPDQFEATSTLFASMQLKKFSKFQPVIYWRRHFDRFQLFRDSFPAWYRSHNYHRTDVYGSTGNYSLFHSGKFSTNVGYDLKSEKIISNKLGDSLAGRILVRNNDSAFYYLGKSRTNASIFAEQNYQTERLLISAGIMLNYYDLSIAHMALFPGIDASWKLNRNLSIYASVNKTLRLPTFTDLYYNDAVSIGNQALLPEKAYVAETGLKYHNAAWAAEIAVFDRFGINLIDWTKQYDSLKWQASNLTDLNVFGIEAGINYHATSGSKFVKTFSFSNTYLNPNKSSEGFISKYTLDILQHKADLRFSHRIYKGFSAEWQLSYQHRYGGYFAYKNGISDNKETPFPDVFLLNTMIQYQFRMLTLYLQANNLLDAQYVDYGNILQPGRWIFMGIEVNLKNQ